MNLKPNQIYIPGNVPSSKNNKQIVRSGKFTKLIDSERVRQYISNTLQYWTKYKRQFQYLIRDKDYPIHIQFQFIRDSKRRFDFVNPMETLLDCMSGQKYRYLDKKVPGYSTRVAWIPDDDYKHVVPFPHPKVIINKELAGVIIEVL